MDPVSVYVHIPFCTHRCGYCDFNTYAGLENLIPAYVEGLIAEAKFFARGADERFPVQTIFFGGGTPSLLPLNCLEEILNALADCFVVAPDAEVSLEANPGTVDLKKLRGFRRAGINRLSFGVQSANPEELRLLERQHDFQDVIQAVKWARQAGFDNLNLDWIYGLPGQSVASWRQNLELAIGLSPEHLSLYALSIEHGTPFKEMSARGLLPPFDSDLAADMYELASQKLEQAGYIHYEISNWAKPDLSRQPMACRHNLQYWRNLPYVGFGAGAHGYFAGLRIANVLSPAAYVQRLQRGAQVQFPRTPATASAASVDEGREMGETMMMGLRLVGEGISKEQFAQRFGRSLESVYGPEMERLEKVNLLENSPDSLRLTERGRLVGNQVFMEFV